MGCLKTLRTPLLGRRSVCQATLTLTSCIAVLSSAAAASSARSLAACCAAHAAWFSACVACRRSAKRRSSPANRCSDDGPLRGSSSPTLRAVAHKVRAIHGDRRTKHRSLWVQGTPFLTNVIYRPGRCPASLLFFHQAYLAGGKLPGGSCRSLSRALSAPWRLLWNCIICDGSQAQNVNVKFDGRTFACACMASMLNLPACLPGHTMDAKGRLSCCQGVEVSIWAVIAHGHIVSVLATVPCALSLD